jgi:hypothetical protein
VRPADFDGDGDVDLAVSNGNLSPVQPLDLRTDPANRFVENVGGQFEVRPLSPEDLLSERSNYFVGGRDDRGLVSADLDGDGDTDLLVAPLVGEFRVLRNDTATRDTLAVTLVGSISERDAIGATVTLRTATTSMKRWLYRGGVPTSRVPRRWSFRLLERRRTTCHWRFAGPAAS